MKRLSLQAILLSFVLLGFEAAEAQTLTADRGRSVAAEFHFTSLQAPARAPRRAGFALMPASHRVTIRGPMFTVTPLAANLPVQGSGTVGRLAKWTALTSSSAVIGNTTIFEDKNGLVGIGTDTPTSRLTVVGLIESKGAGGGVKFPDGTVQTSSAAGALFSVAHDATLAGNGTVASPLGIAIPLTLEGVYAVAPLLTVSNTGGAGDGIQSRGGAGGNGVIGVGGSSNNSQGGHGMVANGGSSDSSPGGAGLRGLGGGSNSSAGGFGVLGFGGSSDSGLGGVGVVGTGGSSNSSLGGTGVEAHGGNSDASEGGVGVVALGGSGPLGDGLSGRFIGDVEVSGTLSKGGGSFKIDHPLDPENKYLYHSFVESPDMKNIYDGVATLDSNGEAVIELPEWFQSLNRDFRYLLTPIGAPMPGLFVAEKVKENHFKVAGGRPGMEVSWQVTGIRQDAFANKHRIQVEVEKPERERGYYLHPEAFDQPEERGLGYLKHPELMRQRKEARERAVRKPQ